MSRHRCPLIYCCCCCWPRQYRFCRIRAGSIRLVNIATFLNNVCTFGPQSGLLCFARAPSRARKSAFYRRRSRARSCNQSKPKVNSAARCPFQFKLFRFLRRTLGASRALPLGRLAVRGCVVFLCLGTDR